MNSVFSLLDPATFEKLLAIVNFGKIQVKPIGYLSRGVEFIEKVPPDLLNEVLVKVNACF